MPDKWSQQEYSLLQDFNFLKSQTNIKSTLIYKTLGGEVRPGSPRAILQKASVE